MDTGKIISAERLGQQTLLISLSDGTDILVTLDQLLSMGGPRFIFSREDELDSSEPPSRKANKTSASFSAVVKRLFRGV